MFDPCQLDIVLDRLRVSLDPCQLDIDFPQVVAEDESELVSLCLYSQPVSRQSHVLCHQALSAGQATHSNQYHTFSQGDAAIKCTSHRMTSPERFVSCDTYTTGVADSVTVCNTYLETSPDRWQQCEDINWGDTVSLADCFELPWELPPLIVDCMTAKTGMLEPIDSCLSIQYVGEFIDYCLTAVNSETTQPPCIYRPVIIDEPEPPSDEWVCGYPRDPCDLTLNLIHPRHVINPCQLEINFDCVRQQTIPILGAYIMLNTSQILFDGKPIDYFSISIKTDIDSWCWAAEIAIPPTTFELLNIDGRSKDNPAIIDVTINDYNWRLQVNDYSDTIKFANKSYTISCESTSSQLAIQSIAARSHTYTSALYARQIIDAELANLPFSVETFDSVDWLVPANTYSYSDKTPMAVINEIAASAGCYVETHRTDAKISIKKRSPKTIWQLDNVTPDVTVPSSVIYQRSGQRRVTQRCNGVFVHGQANGVAIDATLNGSDGNPRHPTYVSSLITDDAVGRQKAAQLLTNTGTHKNMTLLMPLSQKYSINLAELGQLWQVNDTVDEWLGQVTGVQIDAVFAKVTQTVVLDRYMGEGNA